MFTPCDEDDILSGARQLCAKVPARPTCSEDHNTHCRHPEAPMESVQRQAEAELNPLRPKTAPVKVFGCRPMTTATRTPGPASANLQGRKPRDMGRRGASDAMGISSLSPTCAVRG